MWRAIRELWHQYKHHGDAELDLLRRRTLELKQQVDSLRAAAAARRAAEEAVTLRELRAAADAVAAAASTVDDAASAAASELDAAGARADAGLDALARARAAAVVEERGGEEAVWRAVSGVGEEPAPAGDESGERRKGGGTSERRRE